MTATTTYTFYTDSGRVETGLTAEQAADLYLSHDNRDWEMRPMEGGGWQVWDRQQVANQGWKPTLLKSFEADETAARNEIVEQALTLEWYPGIGVMTDEDYHRVMADTADEGE